MAVFIPGWAQAAALQVDLYDRGNRIHIQIQTEACGSCVSAGAVALGQYTEAAVVVVLFSVAEFLERNCSGLSREAVAGVMSLQPGSAVKADTRKSFQPANACITRERFTIRKVCHEERLNT